MPWHPPEVGLCMAMRRMKIIKSTDYHWFMARQGYDDKTSDNMYKSQLTLESPPQLVIARWRGVIEEEEYYDKANKQGINKVIMDNIEKTMRYYPNPQDFIRFAVRETFDSSTVAKYGYDDDYPGDIDSEVAQAGMDKKWMRHFWRAHWELPSVSQAYEMLHRGEIDNDTLMELLRIKDIPSYWREKLVNISFEPYTRVDVRRMYKIGVLDMDGVMRSYKDLGYDDEKASKLTDFTIQYSLEEPKTIAESKIKESYMRGKINAKDTFEMVKDLGYDVESATFIISLWDDDKNEEELNTDINNIKLDYLYTDMSEQELTEKVNRLGLPSTSNESIIRDILNSKRSMMQLPTKSDATRWFNAKIIDESTYRKLLTQLGYASTYVERYIEDTKTSASEEFRVPTKAEILTFYEKKIIDVDEWINYMFALGYSDVDIVRYATLYDISLEEKEGVQEEVTI